MIDCDFLRHAIKQKQEQLAIAKDPAKLPLEIHCLTKVLNENDKLRPVRSQQTQE